MNYFSLSFEKISEIESRYGTEKTPVTIGGKTLEIVQVKKMDQMIEKQLAKKDILEEFPFWAKIWESSIILGHHLVSIKPESGKEMLEVGAGLGVAGLFAAAFGHSVTITDYSEDALAFSVLSAQANGLENVKFQFLDWYSPQLLKKYHYIIGSEVLFNTELTAPLLKLLEEALAPGGCVIFAHDSNRVSPRKFFEMAQHSFDIRTKKVRMHSGDEEFQILLHRMDRK